MPTLTSCVLWISICEALPELSLRRKNDPTVAHTQTHTTCTGAQTLFERWIRAEDAWVFVMDEGISICWSISGRFSLFRRTNKLQHKMHYLASVCQPSCLCIWFSITPVCLPAFLCVCVCVCVCVSARRGRPGGLWGVYDDTGAQTSVVRQQRRIPGQHHRQHLLAGERQSWSLVSHHSQSSSFISSILYTSSYLLCLCISAVRVSLTSLSTALVSAGTLHRHTPT